MPMIHGDLQVERMLKAGGGIKPAYRPQIVDCLKRRYNREGDEYMRATPATRKLVRRTKAHFSKSLECLKLLESNPEFQRYNRKAAPEEIEQLLDQWRNDRAHIAELVEWLSAEQRRLARRSMKGVEDYLRSCFFTELLETRTKSLGIDVPLQASETTTSGPFLEFLEFGLRITEPHLKERQLRGVLKPALDITIRGFNRRRASRDHCWQWDDLFPKTSHILFYNAFPDDSPLVPV
jgi:hypothetical protein